MEACSAHASAYDASPWVQKLAEQLTDELHARLGWIGVDWVDEDLNDGKEKMDALRTKREIKMLDYACGPGMMSRVSLKSSWHEAVESSMTLRL